MTPWAREALAGVAASFALLVAPAAGQFADVLQGLGLAGYPADTRPPVFSAARLDGPPVSLEGLRGSVVLVNFWATWCHECRVELPVLDRIHREYASRGLMVLAVNFREEPSTVRQYARGLGLTMPLLLDPDGAIRQLYGVVGLPTSFLIGRDGHAVARAIGPREWGSAPARTLLRALLAEPPAGR